MNIFFLDKADFKSAEYLCDKHVPKMLLESCQMLSTAVRRHLLHDDELPYIYKSAYPNHPMTLWVGESPDNFAWTIIHGLEICKEYGFEPSDVFYLATTHDRYYTRQRRMKWNTAARICLTPLFGDYL